MEKLTKYFKPIALIGILLLSVGCIEKSKEDSESIKNIRAILQKEFNGPSRDQEKILYPHEDLEKYVKRLSEYNKENLKPYLSERFFEHYVKANGALRFLRAAYPDYELKAEDITIKESERTENSYSFTVQVSYTKNGSNDSKTLNASGIINTNEEGKIVRIHHHDYLEFYEALN